MEKGLEPIADDELLYRRVPESAGWYDPAIKELNFKAFDPHKERDKTGISVSRGRFASIEQAARGQLGKSYFVAVLNAGALRRAGISIEPRPTSADQGHAELPELNSDNRKTTETLERQHVLVGLCISVEGPFLTPQA